MKRVSLNSRPTKGFSIKAFSMIEIMVVTSIIVILMLIAIPAFIGVQQKATRIKCSGKIRKIMSVFQSYSHDNKGKLPRTGFFADDPISDSDNGGTEPLRYDSVLDEHLASLYIWRGDVANDIFLNYFESPDDILHKDDPDVSPDADIAGTTTEERFEQMKRFVEKFFCPTSFDSATNNLPVRWYGIGEDDNPNEPWSKVTLTDPDATVLDFNDYLPRSTTYFSTVTAHLNENTSDTSVEVGEYFDQVADDIIPYDRGLLLMDGRPGSVLMQDRAIGSNGNFTSNHNNTNVFDSPDPPIGENVGYLDGSVAWVEWITGETFVGITTTTYGTIYLANDR